jgi:hypothetical protein
MTRVFVLVDQKQRDRRTNELVSKFDFSSASRYGELVFVVDPSLRSRDPEVSEQLRDGLEDITDDDYILPIGSPVIILLAGVHAALAEANITRLNILEWEWDREKRSGYYFPITINITE